MIVVMWQVLWYATRVSEVARQLKKAVENSGESRYAISQGSGVGQSQLSRLMRGERMLSFDSAERLAAYLGYEIVLRAKTRRKTR